MKPLMGAAQLLKVIWVYIKILETTKSVTDTVGSGGNSNEIGEQCYSMWEDRKRKE